MEPTKNKIKSAIGFEAVAAMVQKAVERWTAKSPKAYALITNIAIGAGIAGTIVTMIPFTYPAWVLPVTALVIAVSAKFTKE